MVERSVAAPAATVARGGSHPGVFEGLQVLRFVAALMVLVTHATFYTSTRIDTDVSVWDAGTAGVDIFFVISGFVMMITSGSFVREPQGWRYFAMRRLVRIVPMYWIATTAKIVTVMILPGVAVRAALDPQHVLFSYLFLPAVNEVGRVEPVLGVGWTLTYEMFFYAIFAVALLVRVNPLVFVGSVMVALSIWGIFVDGSASPWVIYLSPLTLYFVVGMVLAELVRHGLRTWLWVLAGASGCAALVVALAGAFEWSALAPFRFVTVVGLVAATVLAEPLLRRVLPKKLQFFGDASYSIYLFHPLVAPMVPMLLAGMGLPIPWLSIVGAIVWALLVTSLIYVMLERRIIAAGRKLPYAGPVPKQMAA